MPGFVSTFISSKERRVLIWLSCEEKPCWDWEDRTEEHARLYKRFEIMLCKSWIAWWDASVGFKPLASYKANSSAGSGFLLLFVVEFEAGAEAEAGGTGKEEGSPFVDMTKP